MKAQFNLVIDNNDPKYLRIYDANHGKTPLLLAILHLDQWYDLFGAMGTAELEKRQPCTVTMTLEWDE